jgi:hypothetical protein
MSVVHGLVDHLVALTNQLPYVKNEAVLSSLSYERIVHDFLTGEAISTHLSKGFYYELLVFLVNSICFRVPASLPMIPAPFYKSFVRKFLFVIGST